MLAVVLISLFCHLVTGTAGQFQEVRPSFCPSGELVGATCDSSTTLETPTPSTFDSQVNHLRCQSGCLMDRDLNILKDSVVDEEDIWASFNPNSVKETEQDKLDVCRRQCLLYGVFIDLVNPMFTEMQCRVLCLESTEKIACDSGCSIGNRFFKDETANNPDMAPVQPTGTPPIFFDTQSSSPWEFSLNLSAVVPTNTTQLRPNASGPITHGFVLQIIVEQNGKNTTHNHYMLDPSGPGSIEFSNFLSSLRCHAMYLSIAVVNFYGRTNLTEFTRTCIPGPYSLIEEPTLDLGPILVNQGDLPNPSLGSITLSWFSPRLYPLFGDPTYEVSASYIKWSEELDMRCQPDGGDVEFRQRNLSSDIVQFTIESGPHGNIQLLPPGIGPCVYRVTLEALWVSPSVTIPFLQTFRRRFPRTVNIIYVPDDIPNVRVTAFVSNASGDGFYSFSNASFAMLDPPLDYFYESFNAINWTVSLFSSVQGEYGHVISVVEKNPTLCSAFSINQRNIPLPDSIRNVKLPPLDAEDSFYILDVELIQDQGFPAVRRDYLMIPRTVKRGQIDSTMARPIPPGPLHNVTIKGCTINEETRNTSLQVAWQLPEMSFGMLVNCSFNISVMEDTAENATVLFVNGASESPKDRNSSLPLPSPASYSNYHFTVVMFCINEHGLSTPSSTSAPFSGSNCTSVHLMPTTSGTPPSPTVEPTPPNCTFHFCTMNKDALCTNTAAEGDCTNQVIACSACYYAKERRPLPGRCNRRRYKCAGLNGANLQSCLRRWGNCVKKKYGKIRRRLRKPRFFLCPEFPCKD